MLQHVLTVPLAQPPAPAPPGGGLWDTLGAWLLNPDSLGTIPAWFGGAAFVLALWLFVRDRRRDDRVQIDKTAVWVTAEVASAIYGDGAFAIPGDEPMLVRILASNANDVPIKVEYALVSVRTVWRVQDDEVTTPKRGTTTREVTQLPFLLAPRETRPVSESGQVLANQAPAGAVGLDPDEPIDARVVKFLAADNAGRRWKVEPGRGRRALRVRWYHRADTRAFSPIG